MTTHVSPQGMVGGMTKPPPCTSLGVLLRYPGSVPSYQRIEG
jgi:hypothetical protein